MLDTPLRWVAVVSFIQELIWYMVYIVRAKAMAEVFRYKCIRRVIPRVMLYDTEEHFNKWNLYWRTYLHKINFSFSHSDTYSFFLFRMVSQSVTLKLRWVAILFIIFSADSKYMDMVKAFFSCTFQNFYFIIAWN